MSGELFPQSPGRRMLAKLKDELIQQLSLGIDLSDLGTDREERLVVELRAAAEALMRMRADLLGPEERRRIAEEAVQKLTRCHERN